MSKNLLRISFYVLLSFSCIIIGYLISEKEFDQSIKYRIDRFIIANSKTTKEHQLLSKKSLANSIELLIEDKDIEKLNDQRKLALELGNKYRYDKRNSKYVKGKLIHKNDTLKVKLRLKGGQNDHYRDLLKCSYKIKIVDDGSFLGMKKFAIQHPRTRDYMNEWYLHKLLNYVNVIYLRYDFINVTINGRNSGIYAIEENMHKNLIENNKLKEGPIFRFDIPGEGPVFYHDLSPYNKKDIKSDSNLLKQYKHAKKILFEFRNGTKKTSEVFDNKKMAKAYALCDLSGHHHATFPFNLKFYYNPTTGLIEPIIYDNQLIIPIENEGLLGNLKSVEAPIKNNGEILFKNDPFSERLFNDSAFFTAYIHYLIEYTDNDWLSEFFNKTNEDAQNKKQIIWKSYPEYDFNKKRILFKNQKTIKEILSTYVLPEIKDGSIIEQKDKKFISIRNNNKLPIELLSVSINGNEITNCCYLLQPNFINELPKYQTIEIKDELNSIVPTCFQKINCPNADVEIKYRYLGIKDIKTANYSMKISFKEIQSPL